MNLPQHIRDHAVLGVVPLNPAAIVFTGGSINGVTVGETTPANATVSRLKVGSSSDLYLTRYAAKQVMISGDGVGAATNAGIIAGYSGSDGFSAIWASTVTPNASNHNVQMSSTGTNINGASFVNLALNNATKLGVTSTLNTSANPLSVTDATDSSSTTTGSLKTAGGLGVAKKLYVGETIYANDGTTPIRAVGTNIATLLLATTSAIGDIQLRFERNSVFAGGLGYSHATSEVYLNQFGNSTRGLTIDSSNTVRVKETTDSSSTTTGSLVTAGGLGVAKKAFFGGIAQGPFFIATSWFRAPDYTKGYVFGDTENTNLSYVSAGVVGVGTGAAGSIAGALSLNEIILSKTITAPGTTGAQTINKSSGRVNFAGAAASLVVTNSLVTADSIITCNIATNDATAADVKAVAAAGSFTIYLGVAPTAETAVDFRLTN